MNDIGPQAKSLFEAARNAGGLPGAKRARIKRTVLMQAAALGTASTVAGGAVAMSTAAKVTLVTVTAVALGGGSASVWTWKKHQEAARSAPAVPSQPRARPASTKPAVVPERPALPDLGPAPQEQPRRTPPRAEVHRTPAAPLPVTEITVLPAGTTAPGNTPESLDSELDLLRQAQDDLRLGLPAQALRRLAAFDRRFPRARLDQERQAIEAIAGCQVHPGPAAVAHAQRFLQQAPLSPLAARVRSACQLREVKADRSTKTIHAGDHRDDVDLTSRGKP